MIPSAFDASNARKERVAVVVVFVVVVVVIISSNIPVTTLRLLLLLLLLLLSLIQLMIKSLTNFTHVEILLIKISAVWFQIDFTYF